MMSNELAGIFMCFIFGLLFTFVSWLSWTRQEAPGHHGRRHRRKDSPFAFWFYLSLHISMAILSLIFAIVFSIHLLRSSWRTVNSGGEGSSRSLTLRPPLPVGGKMIPLHRWSCLQRQPSYDLKRMAFFG
jgi:hypothetical protein